MIYHKLMVIAGMLIIGMLGAINSWADDVTQCRQFYDAKRYDQAFPVCNKAAARGNVDAQHNLGSMYEYGKGVKKNYSEMIKWYRKAAEQGDGVVQFKLGVMYDNGLGVKKNYTEAAKWYRAAAKGPYGDGRLGNYKAQFRLGEMYDFGDGVKQDYSEAAKWYRAAAKLWDAKARFRLGVMYEKGRGVKKNYAEAVRWYCKAALQGYAKAQTSCGLKYLTGQAVKKDYVEAVKWFRPAAQQGNIGAQYMLGIMYDNGLGVKKNLVEAVKWFRKAAEQGYADAQVSLGVMYSKGRGVLQSATAATDWYYKAGLSFLKQGKRDDALTSVERIKKQGNVPNAFLGNKLLALIYGGNKRHQTVPKTKQKKTASVVSGTGWPVVGGYVITNHHVVAGHQNIALIRRDGKIIKANVAADDATNDLVLLKPENMKYMPPALPVADRSARVGERVFTVGYPHPDLMGAEPKLTQGIINARTGMRNDPRVYQISVPLQGGNSGGPLLNMNGQVIGITTSKMSAVKVFKWTGDMPQNVNYAVKISYIRLLLLSVDPGVKVSVLPVKKAELSDLAQRVEGSVMMVIAK